MNELLIFICF